VRVIHDNRRACPACAQPLHAAGRPGCTLLNRLRGIGQADIANQQYRPNAPNRFGRIKPHRNSTVRCLFCSTPARMDIQTQSLAAHFRQIAIHHAQIQGVRQAIVHSSVKAVAYNLNVSSRNCSASPAANASSKLSTANFRCCQSNMLAFALRIAFHITVIIEMIAAQDWSAMPRRNAPRLPVPAPVHARKPPSPPRCAPSCK